MCDPLSLLSLKNLVGISGLQSLISTTY